MKRKGITRRLDMRLCLGAALITLLSACAKPPDAEAPPKATESQPVQALPPAPPPAPSPTDLPAPTPTDVQATVARIFNGAVRLNPEAAPVFVVGDFNGDQSLDIAIVVEPVKAALDELNSDVAAWRIRDPLASDPPPMMAVKREEATVRPTIAASDALLLAVIHGYGPQGWRDPQARQTILLKNTVSLSLMAQPRRAALAASKNAPPLRGDVIRMTVNGAAGFLYYSNSSYAWYDPRTYRGELVARGMH
jgi:hypothetical protein